MKCTRDESLLMLAHGQLGYFAALQVRMHARRCPECRARLSRFSALSGALALALASPGGPRWLNPVVGKLTLSKGLFLSVVALILFGGFWALNSSAEASPVPLAPSTPCATAQIKVCHKKVAAAPTSRCGTATN